MSRNGHDLPPAPSSKQALFMYLEDTSEHDMFDVTCYAISVDWVAAKEFQTYYFKETTLCTISPYSDNL